MLERFYSCGQVWDWADLEQGGTKTRSLAAWLAKCPKPSAHPLMLPVKNEGEADASWLAIAFSEKQCEELRENLNCFVGSAGCDFDGRRAAAVPSDPVDVVAREWAGGDRIFRFKALSPAFQKAVSERVKRMVDVWRLLPEGNSTALRTTEAMLREFQLALVNQNEASARRWLEELRAGGRLNEENLLFLKVEIAAALGHWRDIVLDPNLPLLAKVRRPRRITGILVEALWQVFLREKIEADDLAGALAIMREQILPANRGLFRTHASLRQPSLVLTFLIAAAADNPPRHALVPELLGKLPEASAEGAVARKIAATLSPPPQSVSTRTPLEDAKEAIMREDFDTAWSRLQGLPTSKDKCRYLLECALGDFDGPAAATVIGEIAALPEVERSDLLSSKRSRGIWQELSKTASFGGPQPHDWESWLDAVDEDPLWPQAKLTAENAPGAWPLELYLKSPPKVEALAKRLNASRDAGAAGVVRNAFGDIAGYFLNSGETNKVFRPLYLEMLQVLAVDAHFGGEDWNTAEMLVAAAMNAGPSRVDYGNMLSALTTIWDERRDLRRMDWALDLLDLMVVGACPDPAALDAFFDSVAGFVLKIARRMEASKAVIFRLLCKDLGRADVAAALEELTPAADCSEDVATHANLMGKMIAIYTLEESAGKRAKQLIEIMYEGADIRLSHDLVGSDNLRNLARHADYFLVATRCAKHAATEFIKKERPVSKRHPDYPLGKGSSSIVTALQLALQS